MTRVPSTVEDNHMSATSLNSQSRLARFCTTPTSPYPIRLFITRPLQCLPLPPQTRTLRRSSTIKTRASGSPSKRWGTCETADHNPQAQLPLVCTISLPPPSSLSSFVPLLTMSTRVPVFTSKPRPIIFNLTARLRRRCEFSRFRRPRINNTSRKHRLASL